VDYPTVVGLKHTLTSDCQGMLSSSSPSPPPPPPLLLLSARLQLEPGIALSKLTQQKQQLCAHVCGEETEPGQLLGWLTGILGTDQWVQAGRANTVESSCASQGPNELLGNNLACRSAFPAT